MTVIHDAGQIDLFVSDHLVRETKRPSNPAYHPDQVTIFDVIAEAEAAPPADLLAVVREHFDSIWRGETGGFSRVQLEESLAENERTLADLEAGRITPRRVIGNGYKKPKTVAREYLHRVIVQGRRDLATEGRTDCTNIANVRHRLCTEFGWDSVAAGHRVAVETDRVHIENTLWSLTCMCGDSEYGYTRLYADDARKIEAHMVGQRVLGRGATA